MSEDSNIKVAYELGFTPSGTTPLTIAELEALAKLATENQVMLHTVEGYRLEGDDLVLALELSLFGPDREAGNLVWPEQVRRAEKHVLSLISDAKKQTVPMRFQVWLSSGQR
jgi:hypothetical protein